MGFVLGKDVWCLRSLERGFSRSVAQFPKDYAINRSATVAKPSLGETVSSVYSLGRA